MAIAEGSFGPTIRWAFADRSGGVSAAPFDSLNLADHVGDDPQSVHMNRAALSTLIGTGVDGVVAMAPVHGNAVGIVRVDTVSPVPDVDAMVTATPGKALLVVGADCSPVVLGDGMAGVIGVAHSGWRGIESNVASSVIAAMCDLGADVQRINAIVGPSICGSCYEVDQARFDATVAVADQAGVIREDGTFGLDIRLGVMQQLREVGVQVSTWGGCTYESSLLFSYRRDCVTGRHGAMIALTPETGMKGIQRA